MLCMTLQICNLFNIHSPMHYKDILPLERHNMQHKFLCDQNSKFTILLLKNSHFFFFFTTLATSHNFTEIFRHTGITHHC